MSLTHYSCTHCGNHFEAEDREGIECPRCFWSSSVKKKEDLPPEQKNNLSPNIPKTSKSQIQSFLATFFFLFLAILMIGFAVIAYQRGWLSRIKEIIPKIEKSEKVRAIKSEENSPASADKGLPSTQGSLSSEENEILNRHIEVSAERVLTSSEQKILENHVDFQTGFAERLPSQPWTFENFKQMIKEQEDFYKVPLPSSYKKKLEKLFTDHYLPGKDAFEKGDLLSARNHWVDALNIPMYSHDIQRHRGVALTMLKPFLNDTLSKIGAINNSLLEKKIREKETQVTQKYQELLGQLKNHSWKEAASNIALLHQILDELENPELVAGKAPPYPAAISQIDQGIRQPLMEMLDIPAPPVAAFDSLRKDLADKNEVTSGLLPQRVDEVRQTYDEALGALQKQDWKKAEAELRKIHFPEPLVKDAQEKLAVLKKLQISMFVCVHLKM